MTPRTHLLFAVLFLVAMLQTSMAQNIQYNSWNRLLEKHVSNYGKVNYAAIQKDSLLLEKCLSIFSKNKPDSSWSKNEILAYWINAYNAFTIKLIVDHYPIKSIKDIKKPWDKTFIPIGTQQISLNYIEHDILRKMNEPRIHFAIVCASKSCPKLQNKAFVAYKLEEQLTTATKDFLNDTSKNNISKENIKLSKIFKWFSEDFTQNATLIDFLNQYTPVKISPNAKKSYNSYNWNLNE